MHPAAEDNYGTDACFTMCLNTQPPVLVIATSEGKLHHCVLLGDRDAGPGMFFLSLSFIYCLC